MEGSLLPDGWACATLGELVSQDGLFSDGDWIESKDQDPLGDVRLVQLADVGDGTFLNRSRRYLTTEKALQLGCSFLEPGDVLIARMPDPLGRACIFPGDRQRCITAVDVCIVRTGKGSVDHRWLVWAINSPHFRARIAALQSGSTRQRISRSNLATIQLPIPPLSEQRRIVAEIEKQFSRLDAAVEALKRAQANLRRYRASVLKAACEGRLVPQDPNDEPASELLKRVLVERQRRWQGKYRSPAEPDAVLPILPEGWVWATLDQCAWDSGYGTSEKCSYEADGPPVLRIPNIAKGRIDLSDLKRSVAQIYVAHSDALESGDLLVVRTNGSKELIGRSALVRESFSEPHFFASYLIRFRLITCLAHWISAIWDSDLVRGPLVRGAATTAGQYNISLGVLGRLSLPIPPQAEQVRIVAEVERRLSVADDLEATIDGSLRRAERLRQAILKRAFEGRLVAQDPNEEPASVLLERIRVGRLAGATSKKRKSGQQGVLPM